MKVLQVAQLGSKSIAQFVLENVQYILKQSQQVPVDLQKIAALRKIVKIEFMDEDYFFKKLHSYGDRKLDADLEPVLGGFTVKLSRRYDHLHRRYSLAHEIIHTFFYDLDCEVPRRIIILEPDLEEKMCELGASELLMPSQMFMQFFEELYNTCKSYASLVKRLANVFDVSCQAATYKLAEKKLLPNPVLISKWRFRDRRGYGKSDYRLDWYAKTQQWLPQLFKDSRLKNRVILNFVSDLAKQELIAFSWEKDKAIKIGNHKYKGINKVELLRLDNHMFFPSFLMVLHF
jgi:hypothetical protein